MERKGPAIRRANPQGIQISRFVAAEVAGVIVTVCDEICGRNIPKSGDNGRFIFPT